MNRYDFLVVGGGPVGCRVGAQLAKAGHQVAVLEKNPSVGGPVCCTGIVSSECLSRFAIPRDLVLKELNSASIFSPSGKTLQFKRHDTQAAVIDHGAFNAYMAAQVQESGADYLLAHNIIDINIAPDGVMARVAHNGKELIFEARALALACGFGSKMPEKAGFGKAREWAVGAQTEVQAENLSDVEVYLGRNVAPGFFAWLVPTGESTALAGLMAHENANGRLEKFLSSLIARGKISRITAEARYRGITLRPPPRTYADRILLAGDVAGQVKPLTGGGLYFGLLCADLAANTLNSSFEAGDFSYKHLSSYQKGCQDLLGLELQMGYWAHRLYRKLSDRRVEGLMETAGKRGLIASLSASSAIGFDWHGSAMLHIVKQMAWPFAKKPPCNTSEPDPVEVINNG